MSYTSLYLVYKTKVVGYEEYRNSYLSAPTIWHFMGKKYLGATGSIIMSPPEGFWELPTNQAIPLHQRVTMASTYDGAVIPVSALENVAESMKQSHQDIIASGDYEHTHWEDIANDLLDINNKHDHRLIGVALGCTSVSDPWDDWYPGQRELFNCYAYTKGEDDAL